MIVSKDMNRFSLLLPLLTLNYYLAFLLQRGIKNSRNERMTDIGEGRISYQKRAVILPEVQLYFCLV